MSVTTSVVCGPGPGGRMPMLTSPAARLARAPRRLRCHATNTTAATASSSTVTAQGMATARASVRRSLLAVPLVLAAMAFRGPQFTDLRGQGIGGAVCGGRGRCPSAPPKEGPRHPGCTAMCNAAYSNAARPPSPPCVPAILGREALAPLRRDNADKDGLQRRQRRVHRHVAGGVVDGQSGGQQRRPAGHRAQQQQRQEACGQTGARGEAFRQGGYPQRVIWQPSTRPPAG
jgi:hypothetical protein